MKSLSQNKNGVTLIELLTIIVILAIIAAFSIPAFGRMIERTRVDADQANVMTLNRSTRLYLLSNPRSDVFSDTTMDSDALIDYLFQERYLDERVKPLVPEGVFSWNHTISLWLYNDQYIISLLDGLTFGTSGGQSSFLMGTYTGTADAITIPRAIDGTTITDIYQDIFRFGDDFSQTQLTTVSFPIDSEITQIHARAFKDNNLTAIEFPENLKRIDFWAFHNNDIQELIFPDTLETIEGQAFAGNDNLTRITIGTIDLGNLGDNIFPEHQSFLDAYGEGGAGTYVRTSAGWQKE